MTPSDIANKLVYPIKTESTVPGLNGVMVVNGGLTFRELAAIHIAAAASHGSMSEPYDASIVLAAERRANALAAELAKTP